jgi:hypothetical protein
VNTKFVEKTTPIDNSRSVFINHNTTYIGNVGNADHSTHAVAPRRHQIAPNLRCVFAEMRRSATARECCGVANAHKHRYTDDDSHTYACIYNRLPSWSAKTVASKSRMRLGSRRGMDCESRLGVPAERWRAAAGLPRGVERCRSLPPRSSSNSSAASINRALPRRPAIQKGNQPELCRHNDVGWRVVCATHAAGERVARHADDRLTKFSVVRRRVTVASCFDEAVSPRLWSTRARAPPHTSIERAGDGKTTRVVDASRQIASIESTHSSITFQYCPEYRIIAI